MHNLAIALHEKGFQVTGSDDHIRNPAKDRLARLGLLPDEEGWFPERITADLDAVILGMHARKDNPELAKAQELNLPIYSFPEYVYQQCRDKQRVVVAGSHGKTSITSMLMHVLNYYNRKFDYLVGAQVEGFENQVKLTDDAPVVIIEGDEYLASPLDPTPKFLHYHHHIGLVSGIAWDHINVYPDFEDYVRQFDLFADATPKGGTLVYCEEDDLVTVICKKERADVTALPYEALPAKVIDGQTSLVLDDQKYPLQVFGHHNLLNMSGAKTILMRLGITEPMFYEAIQSFRGAANRLELLAQNGTTNVYKDFAHAPSKLKATCQAVRDQFPDRRLIACLELHTFSSINPEFLKQYAFTYTAADVPVVFYNPETSRRKQMHVLTESDIKAAFEEPDLKIFTDSAALQTWLEQQDWTETNLLLMSSGGFEGLNMQALADQLTKPLAR